METTIYLVRHCEAIGNVKRVCHGITDTEITPKGYEQLECLKKRFQVIPLDAVYSSHLKRAIITADYMKNNPNIPHYIDERLVEINCGEWEDIPWADLPGIWPEQSDNWSFHPERFVAPNGESMEQLYNRMKDSILEIANKHKGQTIGIASHGTAVRNALCFAHGWKIDRLSDVQWCDNTAVTKFVIDDSNVKLIYENDCNHLSDSLSTIANQNWWKTGAFE